jgi:hypothetical protein
MKRNLNILSFFLSILFFIASLSFSEEKVQYLKKVGEIKDGFSSERENFFIKITGLCCDDEGNLYVADSGWNKIFKFDSNGKFLMSFGREGQGPGEFMGQRMSNHLKISFGNDGKLYVNDPGNSRISVFTKEGKFLKSHRTPPFTYDTPVVNSKGDIYLFSPSGIKVLDRYDSSFRLMSSLLDIKEHFSFPYGKPPFPILQRADEGECLKLITKRDEIVIVSNYSLKAFVFDKSDRQIQEFELKEERVVQDLKKWIEKVKKTEAWYYPFNGFIDVNGNLCLAYIRTDNSIEIYVYNLQGKLKEIWNFPKVSSTYAFVICSNIEGKIFVPNKTLISVEFYKIEI